VLAREAAARGAGGSAAFGGSVGGEDEGGGAASELPVWFSKPRLDRPPTPEVVRRRYGHTRTLKMFAGSTIQTAFAVVAPPPGVFFV
jgi:hypothetical protein